VAASFTRKSRIEQVSNRIKALAHTDVLVGIPAAENQRKGEPIGNAALLFLQSTGSQIQNIPPRPVLEPSIEHNKALILVPLREAVQAAIQDKPTYDLLDKAGQIAENGAKRWFTDPANHWQPNAPATVKAKGSDQPLIDTAELRRSITHIVRTEEG
jgi:hypothetical protein